MTLRTKWAPAHLAEFTGYVTEETVSLTFVGFYFLFCLWKPNKYNFFLKRVGTEDEQSIQRI